MGRLGLGKIPIEDLSSTVLRLTGATSDRVVTPAKAGIDFAAVKVGRKFMVVSSDPVTGISQDIGTYAVRVSANDVATSGNAPQFAESVILLPEGSSSSYLARVARQIHYAAKQSGITILGGHTEVTPGLSHPIVMVTVFSLVSRFVTSADAVDGDAIMMTKTAGLEGTAELAREYPFPAGSLPEPTLKRARGFIKRIDVTKEAVAAFGSGHVHAMHDCTEGGVVGAVFEMSLASGLGFRMHEELVPVAFETAEICDRLSINPLRLISSGSLLLAVEKGKETEVEKVLRPICEVARIGEFRRGIRIVAPRDGPPRRVNEAPQDELWRVLSRSSGRRNGP